MPGSSNRLLETQDERVVGDRQYRNASGLEQARDRRKHRVRIDDVLEHLATDHAIEARRWQFDPARIPVYEPHVVPGEVLFRHSS